jgi:hypothetical protein
MAAKKQVSLVPAAPVNNLALGASSLQRICDLVDDGAEMTSVIKNEFSDAMLQTQNGVDEFLAYRALIEARYEYAKEIKRMADAEMKKAESVKAASDLRAIEVLEAFPSLPFNGSMLKLGTAKNPPSVSVNFEMTDKTLRNVVDREALILFGVPENYFKTHIVHCLDLKAIGDDLKAGKEIVWAQQKQGKRISTKLREKA